MFATSSFFKIDYVTTVGWLFVRTLTEVDYKDHHSSQRGKFSLKTWHFFLIASSFFKFNWLNQHLVTNKFNIVHSLVFLTRTRVFIHTELEALAWAMEIVTLPGYSTMCFESDCSEIQKLLDKPNDWPIFALDLKMINSSGLNFIGFLISFYLSFE